MKLAKLFLTVLTSWLLLAPSHLGAQSFIASLRAESETNICPGNEVVMSITFFAGRRPYYVEISDHTGVVLKLEKMRSGDEFSVIPEYETTYYISKTIDARDNDGISYNSIGVTFRDGTPVSIESDRQAFLESEDPYPLVSDPSGASFEGPGVSGNSFDPGEAGAAGSPHTITATYVDKQGCVSTDQIQFYVLVGDADVGLYDGTEEVSEICDEEGNYTIRGSNSDQQAGSFALFDAGSGQEVSGQISDANPSDNEATLMAAGLDGDYEIRYSYQVRDLEVNASTSFSFTSIQVIGIRDFPSQVCNTSAPIPLVPVVDQEDPGATWTFSGPGVSGTQEDGFFFDPGDAQVQLGDHSIQLSYTNSSDCSAEASFSIAVGAGTPVQIVSQRTAFLAVEGAYDLTSNPPGAAFSGPGVSGTQFTPSQAGYENSPHTIFASFTDAFGCVSEDSIQFYVLAGLAEVELYAGEVQVDTLCDQTATYTIRGSNPDQLPGSFKLYLAGSSTPLDDNIVDLDPDDNEADLVAEGLEGRYEIVYTYGLEQIEVTAVTTFDFIPLEAGGMHELPDSLCQDADPIPLVPELALVDPEAIWSLSGPGVSGSMEEGYYFDPSHADVQLGRNLILLEYLSSSQCQAGGAYPIHVGYIPQPLFTPQGACLAAGGGNVEFMNLSEEKSRIATWQWDFGDPGSGEANFSGDENPVHFYEEAGERNIRLTAISEDGCYGQISLDTLFEGPATVDFSWGSDCYSDIQGLPFILEFQSEQSSLDTLSWSFFDGEGSLIEEVGRPGGDPDLVYTFPSPGIYEVQARAFTPAGCIAEASHQLELFPSVLLSDTGFVATFDDPQSLWISGSDSGDNSWVRSEPGFTGFTPQAGDYAWVTDLPPAAPGYVEHSWVQSPCFDFSRLERPVLSIDLMRSFVPRIDGAVLLYQDGYQASWKTLGSLHSGVNWYNDTAIYYKPAGESTGWSQPSFVPESDWLLSRHGLYSLGGRAGVKFRMVIATGGSQEYVAGMFNQGLAFDNFSIGEATGRRSVLEYFTNANGDAFYQADTAMEDLGRRYPGVFYDLHYHMDYPGFDPMNANNPQPAATRSFHLGVPAIPFAVLNGGSNPIYRYSLYEEGGEVDEAVLVQTSLEEALFDIELEVDYKFSRLSGQATVTFTGDSYANYVQLYLVVLEKEVSSYPQYRPDDPFRNVVLDMLPSPAGHLLGDAWTEGKSRSLNFQWTYPGYLEDVDQLNVIAFVQDREEGHILQAAAMPHTPNVSYRPQMHRHELLLYPNPAKNHLQVRMSQVAGDHSQIVLYDSSGRLLLSHEVRPGLDLVQLDLSQLSNGLYMVIWKENGLPTGSANFVRQK